MTQDKDKILAELHPLVMKVSCDLASQINDMVKDVPDEYAAHVLINTCRMMLIASCRSCGLPPGGFKELCIHMVKSYARMPEDE